MRKKNAMQRSFSFLSTIHNSTLSTHCLYKQQHYSCKRHYNQPPWSHSPLFAKSDCHLHLGFARLGQRQFSKIYIHGYYDIQICTNVVKILRGGRVTKGRGVNFRRLSCTPTKQRNRNGTQDSIAFEITPSTSSKQQEDTIRDKTQP